MVRVYRSSADIRADDIAPRLFALDQRVVVCLAHRLDVIEVEEQSRIALVRDLMMGDSRSRVMPVALCDDAAATLAGV
jgi:hypothetical protein